jgi:hypothetical protein
MFRRLRWPIAMLAAALSLAQGCSEKPRPNLSQIRADWKSPDTRDLTLPTFNPNVIAVCDPPIGWKPDPLKIGPNHIHEVWLSPTGATAYGVIHFTMPLPVSLNLALSGFMNEMKNTEGQATLLSHEDDAKLPGIRFIAEGGLYRIHANLIIDGWDGWTVYAGTFRAKPVAPDEFDTAVRARENTHVGRPENPDR